MSATPKNGEVSKDVGDAWGHNGTLAPAVVARMAVEASSAYYNMTHPNRGKALIFNHEHFAMDHLRARAGTKVDCETLAMCLKSLGFDVHVYENLKYGDLKNRVWEVAAMDHSENDCLFMAILSHGEMGIIYAYDTQYKLENIWSHFTADLCPSLAGKPKLFFIQACQGDKLDPGVTMSRSEIDGLPIQSYRIPTHADFLIAYSTVPGFYSWRNTTRGSWFIQSLCEELKANGKKLDMLTLLTLVLRRVAVDYESNVPDTLMMHKQKQIPCFTSMLTRLLVFADKPN